jgi:hypothetical protein
MVSLQPVLAAELLSGGGALGPGCGMDAITKSRPDPLPDERPWVVDVNGVAILDAVRHYCIVTEWPFPGSGGVPSPRIVAAWAQLGQLPTEKVPLWAAHWLVAGYDGEHLISLAGLHGDDPHDVRDVLPDALLDCGVAIPDSDVAAASLSFNHLARMHVDGLAAAQWVSQKVEEVLIRSGYDRDVFDLPLGCLLDIADEWGDGRRTDQELAAMVREACEEQLRYGSVAT